MGKKGTQKNVIKDKEINDDTQGLSHRWDGKDRLFRNNTMEEEDLLVLDATVVGL